jgi:Dynamin GTPase effector domain
LLYLSFGTLSDLQVDDVNDEPPLTERERLETDLIRSLISSYFHIVKESIQDLVPKAIMHLLVNHCKEVGISWICPTDY